MIIDTTQTKTEREIGTPAFELVSNVRIAFRDKKQAKRMWAIMLDAYGGGCSCHISPPCSYCVAHSECALCGDIVLNDYMVEVHDDWVCEECHLASEKHNGCTSNNQAIE